MSDIHNHTSFKGTSTDRQQGADIRWIKWAIVEVGMCVIAACLSLYRIILSLKIIPWTRKAYESLLVNRESCVGKSLQKERQSSKLGDNARRARDRHIEKQAAADTGDWADIEAMDTILDKIQPAKINVAVEIFS